MTEDQWNELKERLLHLENRLKFHIDEVKTGMLVAVTIILVFQLLLFLILGALTKSFRW